MERINQFELTEIESDEIGYITPQKRTSKILPDEFAEFMCQMHMENFMVKRIIRLSNFPSIVLIYVGRKIIVVNSVNLNLLTDMVNRKLTMESFCSIEFKEEISEINESDDFICISTKENKIYACEKKSLVENLKTDSNVLAPKLVYMSPGSIRNAYAMNFNNSLIIIYIENNELYVLDTITKVANKFYDKQIKFISLISNNTFALCSYEKDPHINNEVCFIQISSAFNTINKRVLSVISSKDFSQDPDISVSIGSLKPINKNIIFISGFTKSEDIRWDSITDIAQNIYFIQYENNSLKFELKKNISYIPDIFYQNDEYKILPQFEATNIPSYNLIILTSNQNNIAEIIQYNNEDEDNITFIRGVFEDDKTIALQKERKHFDKMGYFCGIQMIDYKHINYNEDKIDIDSIEYYASPMVIALDRFGRIEVYLIGNQRDEKSVLEEEFKNENNISGRSIKLENNFNTVVVDRSVKMEIKSATFPVSSNSFANITLKNTMSFSDLNKDNSIPMNFLTNPNLSASDPIILNNIKAPIKSETINNTNQILDKSDKPIIPNTIKDQSLKQPHNIFPNNNIPFNNNNIQPSIKNNTTSEIPTHNNKFVNLEIERNNPLDNSKNNKKRFTNLKIQHNPSQNTSSNFQQQIINGSQVSFGEFNIIEDSLNENQIKTDPSLQLIQKNFNSNQFILAQVPLVSDIQLNDQIINNPYLSNPYKTIDEINNEKIRLEIELQEKRKKEKIEAKKREEKENEERIKREKEIERLEKIRRENEAQERKAKKEEDIKRYELMLKQEKEAAEADRIKFEKEAEENRRLLKLEAEKAKLAEKEKEKELLIDLTTKKLKDTLMNRTLVYNKFLSSYIIDLEYNLKQLEDKPEYLEKNYNKIINGLIRSMEDQINEIKTLPNISNKLTDLSEDTNIVSARHEAIEKIMLNAQNSFREDELDRLILSGDKHSVNIAHLNRKVEKIKNNVDNLKQLVTDLKNFDENFAPMGKISRLIRENNKYEGAFQKFNNKGQHLPAHFQTVAKSELVTSIMRIFENVYNYIDVNFLRKASVSLEEVTREFLYYSHSGFSVSEDQINHARKREATYYGNDPLENIPLYKELKKSLDIVYNNICPKITVINVGEGKSLEDMFGEPKQKMSLNKEENYDDMFSLSYFENTLKKIKEKKENDEKNKKEKERIKEEERQREIEKKNKIEKEVMLKNKEREEAIKKRIDDELKLRSDQLIKFTDRKEEPQKTIISNQSVQNNLINKETKIKKDTDQNELNNKNNEKKVGNELQNSPFFGGSKDFTKIDAGIQPFDLEPQTLKFGDNLKLDDNKNESKIEQPKENKANGIGQMFPLNKGGEGEKINPLNPSSNKPSNNLINNNPIFTNTNNNNPQLNKEIPATVKLNPLSNTNITNPSLSDPNKNNPNQVPFSKEQPKQFQIPPQNTNNAPQSNPILINNNNSSFNAPKNPVPILNNNNPKPQVSGVEFPGTLSKSFVINTTSTSSTINNNNIPINKPINNIQSSGTNHQVGFGQSPNLGMNNPLLTNPSSNTGFAFKPSENKNSFASMANNNSSFINNANNVQSGFNQPQQGFLNFNQTQNIPQNNLGKKNQTNYDVFS